MLYLDESVMSASAAVRVPWLRGTADHGLCHDPTRLWDNNLPSLRTTFHHARQFLLDLHQAIMP